MYRSTFGEERARAHNRRLTSLVMMFVDGASAIDESDPRWICLTCYKAARSKEAQPSFTMVGYVTLYPFVAMVGGQLGERLRLSQILILPPYQVSALLHEESINQSTNQCPPACISGNAAQTQTRAAAVAATGRESEE